MDEKKEQLNINEFHWHLGLLQTLDVGLVVLDSHCRVHLWNSFMEHYSGIRVSDIRDRPIFELFPELPEEWLRRKLDTVFVLNTPVYISWEQRERLFNFRNHHPITGSAEQMYQNITLMPLSSPKGQVEHIGMLIYDVTDIAVSQLALHSANAELKCLSRIDRLSGVFNRGFWQELFEKEFNRFARTHSQSTLMMLDIDHFKKVNDTYGHQAGDEVIKRLASIITTVARNTDLVGRYGGEEFVILLVDTPMKGAVVFAERVRKIVEADLVEYADERIEFKISGGLAMVDLKMMTPQEWLEAADQALYQSKQNGRNRITVHRG